MKWILIFAHMLGNPTYETGLVFDTLQDCEKAAKARDRRKIDQFYHFCQPSNR